jgi:cytochrome bd-type quinol oxidase subunit 1
MQLPQLNYGDFYKFIVSLGTVLASIGAVLTYQASSLFLSISDPNWKLYLVFFSILSTWIAHLWTWIWDDILGRQTVV